MPQLLSGRVAIVTGSSRGIGAAIARQLATDGANVVVNYVNSGDAAEHLVHEISSEGGGKAIAIRANLSTVAEGRRLIDESVKAFGRLDILVHNAGVLQPATLAAIDEDAYNNRFNTSVKIPLFMTQYATLLLKPGGRIIFISSSLTISSRVPYDYVLYAASKGATEQIVRVLAKDLGTKGITVNAVAPGTTDTDLFRAGKSEAVLTATANLHPMKRLGLSDDIAPAVSFLASEQAAWVNGQTICVNGGLHV